MPLKMLEQGEHKKTVDSVIIVSDKYLELKQQGNVQGLIRVVLYLQDLGVAQKPSGSKKDSTISLNAGQGAKPPGMTGESNNPVEDQIVWQLEMWKRSEMAKFLAHLK